MLAATEDGAGQPNRQTAPRCRPATAGRPRRPPGWRAPASARGIGYALLASCVFGWPLIFHAARRLVARSPEADAAWEQRWRTVPELRRAFGLMSAVWGAGLLAEALLRIALVFVLPTDVMVGVPGAMLVSTMIALSIWNGAYARRLMARAQQASAHESA